MKRLMIVVPCFNEEEVFPTSTKELIAVVENLIEIGKISADSGILFVNDGSRDRTWELISKAHKESKYIYGLNLAGNVGHQNALLAGLNTVKDFCDISISIDADLQDDVGVIEEMIDKYYAGADIVYGVRSERKADSFFKRFTAQSFYKFMSAMGVKSVHNHADFRLMSARAMQALSLYKERNLFLRGIVPQIGYKTDCVYYKRQKRTAGKTKYSPRKMLKFAWEGITSFSIRPMKLIMALGLVIMLCSFLALCYVLASYFFRNAGSGWPSLMISIWFLGGVQLFSIGVVGQYIGKIYLETKGRPRYNIDEVLNHENNE